MRLYNILNSIITRLKSVETSIASLEIESGTVSSGSITWKYKKYRDNSLEMWGSGTTTLAISTAYGSMYTTANEYEVSVPSFVASTDFLTGEISSGAWIDSTAFVVPPKIRFYAPTSYASASRTVRYYFRGTWA